MISLFGGLASLFSKSQNAVEYVLVALDDYPETKIIDLIVYPCRGVAGIHVKSAEFENSGAKFDREWFLLNKNMDPKYIKKPGKRWVSIDS